MRITTIVSSLILGVGLLAGGALLSTTFASDHPPADERAWLPIGTIHDQLKAAGYRTIEKIEREHGRYEVRALNRKGERVKLYLDPHTGAILDPQARKYKHDEEDDGARRSDKDSRRGDSDYGERRSRDDMPRGAAPAGGK